MAKTNSTLDRNHQAAELQQRLRDAEADLADLRKLKALAEGLMATRK